MYPYHKHRQVDWQNPKHDDKNGMSVMVEIPRPSRSLNTSVSCDKKNRLNREKRTLSRANFNARTQVAIWTMQATMYANWYGIRVATKNKSMKVVMIRRLGLLVEKAGDIDFLCFESKSVSCPQVC